MAIERIRLTLTTAILSILPGFLCIGAGVSTLFAQQADPISADSMKTPTLVIHPAVQARGLADHCEVDLRPSDASSGYRLELRVPDSITEIDITPTNQVGRSGDFRISLDRGNRGPAPVQPVASGPEPDQQNLDPRPQGAYVPVETRLSDSFQMKTPKKPTNRGFRSNPFFYQATSNVAQANPAPKQPGVAREASSQSLRSTDLPARRTVAQAPTYRQGDVAPVSLNEPQLDVRTLVTLGKHDDPHSTEGPLGAHPLVPIPAEPTDSRLSVSVEPICPSRMNVGGTADFVIMLTNQETHALSDFQLQLKIPEGLVVKVLDRPANFNAENRTVTWSFPYLAGNSSLALRYRMEATEVGESTQRLRVGNDGDFGAPTDIVVDAR